MKRKNFKSINLFQVVSLFLIIWVFFTIFGKDIEVFTDEGIFPIVDALEKSGYFLFRFLFLQIHNYFGNIFQNHFNESFSDRSWVIHCGGSIDLNKPRVELVVNHEIIANEFKRVFSGVDLIGST